MADAVAWVNGAFVAAAAVEDQLWGGVGAFETLAARGAALPLWQRHLTRLEAAARRLDMPWAPPVDLAAAAGELLRRSGHPDGILRITLRAGDVEPRWLLTARARPVLPVVALHVVEVTRRAVAAPTAGFKSVERGDYDLPLAQARAAGADDALLVDRDGRVLETAHANVLVEDTAGNLYTPPLEAGIVPGVARAALRERLPIAEREVALAELPAARRVWVCNAVHGPRPARLDDHPASVLDHPLAAAWREILQ